MPEYFYKTMSIKTLFFIVLVLEIGFSLAGNRTGVFVFKPLLMPLLLVVAYQSGVKSKMLYPALIFSFLGDVFLMFSGENYFIYGLGSFLLAHIFYIFSFGVKRKYNIITSLLFLIYSSVFFYLIYPNLNGGLLIPVLVYCIVLTLMGITAWHRGMEDKQLLFFGLGAILFIISDSLIAYSKFVTEIPLNSLWVMSTYGFAQYLILQGFINSESDI